MGKEKDSRRVIQRKKDFNKKTFDTKRKLTIGRALSDSEGEIRQRSYASVKRARDKIFKKNNTKY